MQNNRFKCLMDDAPKVEVPHKKSRHNTFISQERKYETRVERQKRQNKKQEIDLNKEYFPSLSNIPHTELTSKSIMIGNTYLETIDSKQPKQESLEKEINELPFGFIQLKMGYNYNLNNYNTTDSQLEAKLNPYLFEEIHQRQRSEKIDILGEDLYEKEFKFPNYDYEYFELLDEMYFNEYRDFYVNDDSDKSVE